MKSMIISLLLLAPGAPGHRFNQIGHRIHYNLCHPPVSRSDLRNRICEVAQSFTSLLNRLEVRGRPRYRSLNPGTQPTKGPLPPPDTGLNTPGPASRKSNSGRRIWRSNYFALRQHGSGTLSDCRDRTAAQATKQALGYTDSLIRSGTWHESWK
ncbi:hypothetical protein DFH08DRAFT_139371 [Mycena albidolilacea]|uniref:Uncharacterized protein n=1 Tax=Mycena albidolilacea TaxID=1033008 RepID=A0AAD7EUD6_9AGAR|nr:hypothetical protein DFH08DRAFT_139371 [Mycena albidolilacea]